jgi:hypothetical protein
VQLCSSYHFPFLSIYDHIVLEVVAQLVLSIQGVVVFLVHVVLLERVRLLGLQDVVRIVSVPFPIEPVEHQVAIMHRRFFYHLGRNVGLLVSMGLGLGLLVLQVLEQKQEQLVQLVLLLLVVELVQNEQEQMGLLVLRVVELLLLLLLLVVVLHLK